MSLRTSKGVVATEAVSDHLRMMVHDSPSASEVRELIARRAYELYKHRGTESGDELSDWLIAEGEVVSLLLAEPLEAGAMETPRARPSTRKVASPPASKAANGTGQRVARRPKRRITLDGNPA